MYSVHRSSILNRNVYTIKRNKKYDEKKTLLLIHLLQIPYFYSKWSEYDLIASINDPEIPIIAIPGLDEEFFFFQFPL